MRITRDELYSNIALQVAARGTCTRRRVGCVLVDKRGRILATGYNGVPAGAPHCNEGFPCEGATLPSGTGLTKCNAIHAEQNAILLLRDPWEVDTAYVTTFPCDGCIKLLLGTSCRRIVFADNYPHADAYSRWQAAGRSALRFDKVTGVTTPYIHGR